VREALAAGLTREALRHPEFLRPFYGVRTVDLSGSDAGDRSRPELRERVIGRARAFVPRLRPGEAFSHTTALLIHGCPIRCEETLHVSAPPPFDRNRSAGVVGHRCSDLSEAWSRAELPTVSAAVSLLQGASILSLPETVVAVDHLIAPLRRGGGAGALPRSDLAREISRARGRGVARLRLAWRYARVGAESRMETLTRLMLAAYGLDHLFETQRELVDSDGWIGRFDLVSERYRTIIEYDGEQHRTSRAQYLKDLQRLDRARALGYRVVRLHREDVLLEPRRTAHRIADLLGVPARPGIHHHLLMPAR